MQTYYCYTKSPLGELMLAGDANGLRLLSFQEGPEPAFPERGWRKDAAYFVNAIVQLKEYFAGKRTRFALRLNPEGTEFQLRVLETLTRIPYGQTASYADIARLLKNPRAVRAVGAANGKNPLPVVLPCHRVIGSNGKLAGFNGGIERKKWLLALERNTLCARGRRVDLPVGEHADTPEQVVLPV
ncbi:MAG: methylated-DNA--[protein]-cysteine S-methyltransferase [Pseudomonadales bacterium]